MWFKMYSGSIWLHFGARLLAKQLKYTQKAQNGPELLFPSREAPFDLVHVYENMDC